MESKRKSAPILVAAAVIRSGGKFLVLERPADSHLGGTWEFPGGKVEAGESPAEALRREVREEIGLALNDAVLLHVEEYSYQDRSVLLHFFLCVDPGGIDRDIEEGERRWVSLKELRNLPVPPANRRVIDILDDQFGPDDVRA